MLIAAAVDTLQAELDAALQQRAILQDELKRLHADIARIQDEVRVLRAVEERFVGAQREVPAVEGQPEPSVDVPSEEEQHAEHAAVSVPAAAPEAPPLTAEQAEWVALYRTDAILRVLAEENRPLGPSEMARLLNVRGRKDTPNVVSAAIAHLSNKKRVVAADERGKWRLATDADAGNARHAEDASIVMFPAAQAPLQGDGPVAASTEHRKEEVNG